jgi:glycosyltransferase involved in cell wall biosynthesis
MSRRSQLRALIPEPRFPILRSQAIGKPLPNDTHATDVRRMFYLPRVTKHLDGRWLCRCVDQWLNELGNKATENAILDAHFGYPEGVGCYLAARSRGLPCFITIRGLEVDRLKDAKIRPQLVEALTKCEGTIAVSDSLRRAAIDAGVPDDNITVIPNGIDSDLFCTGDRDHAKSKLGQPIGRPLVVCVASFKAVKGHEVLLNAFARLPRDLGTQLVLIGEPTELVATQRIKKAIASLRIHDRVTAIGSRPPDEVATWLRAADVFALASHREGCCNAVLEALATGTPVVATDVGSNRREVCDGVSGFVTPAGDIQAMSEALLKALTFADWCSETISATMSQRTWHAVADQVLQLFRAKTSP